MLIDGREWKLVPVEPTPDWIANWAYNAADAMLKAREGEQ